jgi:hypothetical protein
MHFIPNTTTPFYVGKGSLKRAWSKSSRSPLWKNIVKKYGVEIKILYANLNEQMALFLEKELIKKYGKRCDYTGCLINFTDGGDGISGYIHTEEAKKKIGQFFKGKKLSVEHVTKASISQKGKSVSETERLRLSALRIGTKLSEEHKKKIGDSHRGMIRSDLTRLNLSTGQGATPVKLLSPDGDIIVVTNRSDFCRKYNLHPRCVRHVIRGKVECHNGWSLYREIL